MQLEQAAAARSTPSPPLPGHPPVDRPGASDTTRALLPGLAAIIDLRLAVCTRRGAPGRENELNRGAVRADADLSSARPGRPTPSRPPCTPLLLLPSSSLDPGGNSPARAFWERGRGVGKRMSDPDTALASPPIQPPNPHSPAQSLHGPTWRSCGVSSSLSSSSLSLGGSMPALEGWPPASGPGGVAGRAPQAKAPAPWQRAHRRPLPHLASNDNSIHFTSTQRSHMHWTAPSYSRAGTQIRCPPPGQPRPETGLPGPCPCLEP